MQSYAGLLNSCSLPVADGKTNMAACFKASSFCKQRQASHRNRWFAGCPNTSLHTPNTKIVICFTYTGITRTAKGILAEIVRSMFLNSSSHLRLLTQMKAHALDLSEAIQRNQFEEYGTLVGTKLDAE